MKAKHQISVMTLMTFFSGSFGFALDAEFSGYLRGGTGLNGKGGKQECFYNQGIPGNFLRLGNECGFYSELSGVLLHKKEKDSDPSYFRTQMRLEFNSVGTRQWEPAADRNIAQIEAFVKAGGFSEVPGDWWVGKRFYRDVDLHIFDWYYFADMSGVGAGVENLPLGPGTFSFAHLIQGDTSLATDTSVGKPVLQALDLRWYKLPVGEHSLYVWGVYAWAPRSSTATTEYVATDGYTLAVRLNSPQQNNNLSLLYGIGAMKDLNIYGSSVVPSANDSQNRAWTLRLVEDWKQDVTTKWAMMVGAAAEVGDNGTAQGNQRQWYGVGVRPIYFVTDRFQWVFEAGYTYVKNDSEVDGSGNPVGGRELGRVSISPQLSFERSMWARPVMRAFVSHSFWNSANKSYVDDSAPTFADQLSGTNIGYQFEAWF